MRGVFSITKDDIVTAKEADIVEYLRGLGFEFDKKGKIFWCSSPFANDSTPSFAVYPSENRFKDYSTGAYGDVIELARTLHNLSFPEAVVHILKGASVVWEKEKYKEFDNYKQKPFKLETYLNKDINEIKNIKKYAKSRKITEGYEYGVYYRNIKDKWERFPSLLFLHKDKDMNIIGAKLRNIDAESKDRFSARGKLGFYILKNIVEDSFNEPILYLVESETSANSLYMYFKKLKHSCIVISFGGVGAVPESVPFDMPLKIIIDFDGNEKLYNKRVKLYKHLNGKHIKMMLPKGEDINSLWVKNKIKVVNKLIFDK